MDNKDKMVPFTMETYKQVQPGTKVYIQTSPTNKIHGVSGNLWGAGEPIPVIKLSNGSIVRVHEKMIHLIHLELLN